MYLALECFVKVSQVNTDKHTAIWFEDRDDTCTPFIHSPQVNVSYKCLTIRVALEHTTTLLPRGRGKGGHGIVGMLGKMLCGCDIFSTVLSKIVDW